MTIAPIIAGNHKGSMMATAVRRLTVDDLEILPAEHEGDRHELIDGELVVTPVPMMIHQDSSMNLALILGIFVRSHRLGRIYTAPTGVRLHPETLVIPDICFVSRERLHIIGEKTIDGAPDLVVEILSPGTRQRDLTVKRALYARFGVQEYWIVDPEAKTVTVLTLKDDRYESLPIADDGRIASRVLPGLRLTTDQVFANV
jgi:Uma2 family endonuclease